MFKKKKCITGHNQNLPKAWNMKTRDELSSGLMSSLFDDKLLFVATSGSWEVLMVHCKSNHTEPIAWRQMMAEVELEAWLYTMWLLSMQYILLPQYLWETIYCKNLENLSLSVTLSSHLWILSSASKHKNISAS